MNDLVIVDLDSTTPTIPEEIAEKLASSDILALSPASDFWLKSNGYSFSIPEDYYDKQAVYSQAEKNTLLLKETYGAVDDFVKKTGRSASLIGYIYRTKILLDAFTTREMILNRVLDRYSECQITYLYDQELPADLDTLIWDNTATVYQHLIRAKSRSQGDAAIELVKIDSQPSPTLTGKLVPATVGKRIKRVVFKRRILKLINVIKNTFKSKEDGKARQILFLRGHHELEELWQSALKTKAVERFILNKNESDESLTFTISDMSQRGGDQLLCRKCDQVIDGVSDHLQAALENQWGGNLPASREALQSHIEMQTESITTLEGVYRCFDDHFRSSPVDSILSISIVDPIHQTICAAAKANGIPVSIPQQ